MRRFVIALLAFPLLLLATPSGAASRGELHKKDLTGDANGLNGQAIGLPVPATSTAPASVASADIVALDVVTKYKTVKGKRVPRATAVTLSLAGPVPTGAQFVITASLSAPCDDKNKRIQLGYGDSVAIQTGLAICSNPDSTGNSETIGYVDVVDKPKGKITWILEMGQKPGNTMTNFDVSSTVFVVGVFDEFRPKGTFTYAR